MHNAPALHQREVVGQRQRFFRVVRDQHSGDVLAADLRQRLLAQLAAQAGVEAGKRLVEQKQLRLHRQSARQRHALLLAAGERIDAAAKFGGQPHFGQGRFGAAARFLFAHALHFQAESHVLPHIQMRQQSIILKHQRHAPPLRRHAAAVFAAYPHFAAIGGHEPGGDVEQSRFAAARRPQHRQKLAVGHAEADVVGHGFAGKRFADVFEREHKDSCCVFRRPVAIKSLLQSRKAV